MASRAPTAQEIDHIELFGPPEHAEADGKNFVLCPGRAYDRSPCGTGTSAKLACLAADGKLLPGQVWRQESIVGSYFRGVGRNPRGPHLSADSRLGLHHRRGHARARSARPVRPWNSLDPFMTPISDVVIVGAGIVGAACARALAREGIRVTIVDAAMIGGGATAAGMGHVVVMDDSPAQLALTRYSQQLWRDLVADLPADCEYDPCGTLWVAADEEELVAAREKERRRFAPTGLQPNCSTPGNSPTPNRNCAPAWPAACSCRAIWSSIRPVSPAGCSIRPGLKGHSFVSTARLLRSAAIMLSWPTGRGWWPAPLSMPRERRQCV